MTRKRHHSFILLQNPVSLILVFGGFPEPQIAAYPACTDTLATKGAQIVGGRFNRWRSCVIPTAW
jgi:hypothetical protein